MWWWWRTGIKGQMHACRPFGFMSLPHSWHRDPHACCRFAHMSLTRVPACLRNDCRGSVHMAACGESAAAALCLHAYWSQHVLFRYHPPQISQPGLICSRWQHHTLLHARIHKCVHTHTLRESVCLIGVMFFQWNLMNLAAEDQYLVHSCLRRRSGRHVQTLHALRVDPQPPHQHCTQTNMSLTDTVNHAQIPKRAFCFVLFSGIYGVFKGWTWNCSGCLTPHCHPPWC